MVNDHVVPLDELHVGEPAVVGVGHEELEDVELPLLVFHIFDQRSPVAVREIVDDGSGRVVARDVGDEVLVGFLVEPFLVMIREIRVEMVHEDIYRAPMSLNSQWDDPIARLDDLIEREVVEAPCGDATVLICKPYSLRGDRLEDLAEWPFRTLGSILQWSDLVLVEKPIWMGGGKWRDPTSCPAWTHFIVKSRSGSSFWDMMDNAGYPTYFHHFLNGTSIQDRVFLCERSLRAFKVFVQ